MSGADDGVDARPPGRPGRPGGPPPREDAAPPHDAPRPPADPWAGGDALVWTLGAGVVLLVVGALTGRPDVALLAVAPVAGSLWALWVRPRGEVWVDVERLPPARDGDDGSTHALTAVLHLAAPPGTEAVRLRVRRPGHRACDALVHVPLTRELGASAASVRTGRQTLFTVDHQGIGSGALLTGPAGTTAGARVVVLPTPTAVPALPLPHRLRGLSGQHASRRAGEGGGLRDIHHFQPGDTLRAIDWKVTARRSPTLEQLYVRRTLALAEAMVTLVVDSRDDVGPDPATWSGMQPVRPDDATSLDLARQAAASIAEAYLAVGDRVGVEDLGVLRRALRPGAGRRQLDRVLHQLAVLRPYGAPARRLRAPRLTAGSLVYVFSTFLDPEAADLARTWARAGHRVVAVDVLPRLREHRLDARQRLALRILRIERADRLADVAAAGAEVIRWAEPDVAARRLQLVAVASHRRPGRAARR